MERAIFPLAIPITFWGTPGILHDRTLFIYACFYLYIVSFPASFPLTACFDLTPCGQAGYYQLGKLRGSSYWYWCIDIYGENKSHIYIFSSFFAQAVSKWTLTYSSSTVRKGPSARREQSCPFALSLSFRKWKRKNFCDLLIRWKVKAEALEEYSFTTWHFSCLRIHENWTAILHVSPFCSEIALLLERDIPASILSWCDRFFPSQV